jgi:hypothetical protein
MVVLALLPGPGRKPVSHRRASKAREARSQGKQSSDLRGQYLCRGGGSLERIDAWEPRPAFRFFRDRVFHGNGGSLFRGKLGGGRCASGSRIAAGVSLFELAQFMGTSVDQIDKTYGHLLPDALDRTRVALDTFVGNAHARAEAE